MVKVIVSGEVVDFDAALNLMDDEIRESIAESGRAENEQDFVDLYVDLHAKKYDGEEFTVN